MSGKAKIKAKSINARLELMDSLITHHLWCISNKNLAYSTLKQVCDAINNVQRMSFATPFFIAGGAVFRASVGSAELGDFDLWCSESMKAQAIQIVSLALTDTFGGFEIIENPNGRPHIKNGVFDVQICSVDDSCATTLEIISGFDLNGSQWATDGIEVLYTKRAMDASKDGVIYKIDGSDTSSGEGVTKDRIKRYQSIWANASVYEVPAGIVLPPSQPDDVPNYVKVDQFTEEDDILF